MTNLNGVLYQLREERGQAQLQVRKLEDAISTLQGLLGTAQNACAGPEPYQLRHEDESPRHSKHVGRSGERKLIRQQRGLSQSQLRRGKRELHRNFLVNTGRCPCVPITVPLLLL